ncbi:MAG: glutaredoxin family protein [Anaerolineae bacterium]
MARHVTVYSAPSCTLCRHVLEDLDLLAAEQPLDVRTVDVTRDPALAERYLLLTPVVEIAGGPTLQPPISIGQLRSALAAVQDLT